MNGGSQLDRNDGQVAIQWRFISYRTLFLTVLLIAAAAILVVYSGVFPRLSTSLRGWLNSSGGAVVPAGALAPQARFMNVEGGVLVKPAGSTDFVPAQPSATLNQGDTVQTQSDGWARIEFSDDTTYLLSPNSLIVIEQNQATADSSTVAVNVTSGRVDLSTGHADGRLITSRLRFADAAASLNQDSRAEVVTNAQQGSLTVVAGAANVRRGKDTIQVRPFQRLNVAPGRALRVEAVPQAPQLVTPGNLSPILARNPEQATIHFTWTAVPGATRYRLLLSRSSLMSDPIQDRATPATSLNLSGLAAGSYYWTVSASDAAGRSTPDLDANKFTLIASVAQSKLPLTVDKIIEIAPGVLEVDGATLPGAKVLVNNEVVGLVRNDGSFQYVTPQLPRQDNFAIAVTAEDNAGRVATLTKIFNMQ